MSRKVWFSLVAFLDSIFLILFFKLFSGFNVLKGTVRVIYSDPLCKDDISRFRTAIKSNIIDYTFDQIQLIILLITDYFLTVVSLQK